MPAHEPRVHLAVAARRVARQPEPLALARVRPRARAPAPRRCAGAARSSCSVGPLDVDQQVHPVEQRPAQPPAVAAQIRLAAPAPVADAGEPARARVGGGDEHEPRREHQRPLAAHDRHAPVLERLAQRVEARALELGELVEEQHAVVGERRLARPRRRAAADQPGRARSCGAERGTAAPAPARRRAARRCCGSASPRSPRRASSRGRIDGIRRASIVLPVPGAPSSSRLWPPAAAISSASSGAACPRMSARSGSAGDGARGVRRRRQRRAARRPVSTSAAARRVGTPATCEPLDQRRLARPLARDDQPLQSGPARSLGDRERTRRVAQLAAQRQLAEHGVGAPARRPGSARSRRARRARAPRRTRDRPCAGTPARGSR